jgi:hypothetical protein
MKADTPSPPEPMPSYGIIEKTDDVTDIVLRAIAGAPNARLREVMAAFVRHLHAFAREVRLTQDEYDFAVDFLNRIGKATTDTHNEGILFADAVGFSTLVVLMNNCGKGPTYNLEPITVWRSVSFSPRQCEFLRVCPRQFGGQGAKPFS